MKKHIEECDICNKEYKELLEVDKFLSLYANQEVPVYLNTKVMQRITEKNKRKSILSFIPALASFVIAFYLGIYISNATMNISQNQYTLGSESLYNIWEVAEDEE